MKILVYLLLSMTLQGCAFYPTEKIQTPKQPIPQTSIASYEFQKWNKDFEAQNKERGIQLLPHQKYPIFYLEIHPKQRGLIINQELGTGKTLLAIGFAERYPNRPVFILAPNFLHSHWLEHLDKYQVTDKTRYRFISYDNCVSLLKEDLSDAIVMLDESHRFVEKLRFAQENKILYSQLYTRLQKCHRILSLSATPIYTDIFDLTYHVNLIAGKEVLPFNKEVFRKKLLQTKIWNTYWRGYFVESNTFTAVTGYAINFIARIFFNNIELQGNVLEIVTGNISNLITALIPIQMFPLREFNPAKIQEILNTYFSYYTIDNSSADYPNSFISLQQIDYATAQLNFLYKLYDNQLNNIELQQLLKDFQGSNTLTLDYIRLNNSALQAAYKDFPGAGREIGNFTFSNASASKIIHPPKFEKVLQTIQQSEGPVVVYSHYYYNGLLLFKQFLDSKGYQGQYRILHPEMSKEQQVQIVHEFNQGQLKILLLHPDITEGISLKGTQQLHFLEVPINKALQNQISGRAIRYRSHVHLPLKQRQVHIYIWQYKISMFDLRKHILDRYNWMENFSEFNYYSTGGRIQLDPNALLKNSAPDVRAYARLNTLSKETKTFQTYIKQYSIEYAPHLNNDN